MFGIFVCRICVLVCIQCVCLVYLFVGSCISVYARYISVWDLCISVYTVCMFGIFVCRICVSVCIQCVCLVYLFVGSVHQCVYSVYAWYICL
jgi:hypothetical protein